MNPAQTILDRQAEYFRSDERIRDVAEPWIGVSPEECLRAVAESCAEAEFFLRRLDPAALETALEPAPLPDDTRQLLEALWATRAH